jgi:DNA repair ATPase RecN
MSAGKPKRLGPGELDGLVLSYLCKHQKDGPLTATAIANGLGGRSAGTVANCLARLARDRKVRQVTKAPRAYAHRHQARAR